MAFFRLAVGKTDPVITHKDLSWQETEAGAENYVFTWTVYSDRTLWVNMIPMVTKVKYWSYSVGAGPSNPSTSTLNWTYSTNKLKLGGTYRITGAQGRVYYID